MSGACLWTTRLLSGCDRDAPTLPPQLQNLPHRYEHGFAWVWALNLCAAFDTRAGQVYGQCHGRRQLQEFLAFLEMLDEGD